MGLFDFAADRSDTVSSSSSFNQSQASSISGGAAASSSEDRLAFEDIFARLFGGAEGAAGGLDPSLLTETANTLFTGGVGFLDQIGNDAGTAHLQSRLGGDNEVLQEQIDLLGDDLGKFFNEQLNPAITSQAVAGGALGGGRQGVAQGLATQAVGDSFSRGATALRAGDIAARDAAAGTLAQNSIQGALAAITGIPALGGVAEQGFSAGLRPFELLAGILGDPTRLNSTSSGSANFAQSLSSAFGSSTANSTTESRGFKIGF